jgi:hypothetical protein
MLNYSPGHFFSVSVIRYFAPVVNVNQSF